MVFLNCLFSQTAFYCCYQSFQSFLLILSFADKLNLIAALYAGTQHGEHALCICRAVFEIKCDRDLNALPPCIRIPAGRRCNPVGFLITTFLLTIFSILQYLYSFSFPLCHLFQSPESRSDLFNRFFVPSNFIFHSE